MLAPVITTVNPANATAYARMVMESSLRRQLLVHADRLFRDAGNLHFEVGRFTKVAAPENGVQEFPTHLLKLAHAMRTHARPDGRYSNATLGHRQPPT